MTANLPPEDQTPGQGIVPASDEEVVAGAINDNPEGSPWWIGFAFWQVVTRAGDIDLDVMARLVTPESLASWGDFTAARDLLDNTAITSRADEPDPGVAYVKYITDPGQGLMADSDVPIMARAIATLQFRPELAPQWRVHSLGDYVLAEDLPPLS